MPGAKYPDFYRKKVTFISKNFCCLFSVIYPKFSAFVPTFNIHTITGPLDPPCWMPPISKTFLYDLLFNRLHVFFYNTMGFWTPPRLDARGCRTVRTPLCTPLLTDCFH